MPLFLYIFALYCALKASDASYAGFSYRRMSMKLVYLDMELVKDAERKIQSIQHLKHYYRASYKFRLSSLIYDIKFKFKRMVRLYRVAFEKMGSDNHNVHVIRWMEVHQLSMEIDNLIQAIVEGEENMIKIREERQRQLEKKKNRTSSTTPGGPSGNLETTTKGNDTLRIGKPMWNFMSPDPWNRPRPQYLRTARPKKAHRLSVDPLLIGTKRPIDGVELNYYLR